MSKDRFRILKKIPKNIVIDTIPLLLFLVGTYDTKLISAFKRTNAYAAEDFKILRQFLAYAKRITVTPGVLSEVSNYAEELKDKRFSELIKKNIAILKKMKELYISKENILESNEVYKFGFTDTSIFLAAKNNSAVILTGERPLWSYCQNLGIEIHHLDDILATKELFKLK